MGYKCPLVFFLMVLFFYLPATYAEDMDWSVYRSMNEIYDLAIRGTEAWCVTTEGVVKWDTRDKISEKVSDIRGAKISIDSNGLVWIGGVGKLYCYDGKEWSTIILYEPIYFDDICNELAIMPDGKIWYVTEYENNMIIEYDPRTGQSTKIKNRIGSIAVDSDGMVWCGSGSGLLRFDGNTWEDFSEDDWPYKWIRDVSIDDNGYIWVAMNDGIRCFDGNTWTFHALPERDYLEGTDIAFDAYGNVWVSTIWEQVFKYDGTQWISYTCPNGSYTQTGEIRIACSDDGSVWFVHSVGFSLFEDNRFSVFLLNGLVYNNISNVSVDDRGTVWILTGYGLSSYDGDRWKTYTGGDAIIDTYFNNINVNNLNDLWLLGINKILPLYNNQWNDFSVPEGFFRSDINIYKYDLNGMGWAGTSAGVFYYENMTWKKVEMLPSLNVLDIEIDKNNNVWVCTDLHGVYCYNRERWIHYGEEVFKIPPYLICIPVSTITTDSDGTMYCGTMKGIFYYKNGEWGRYDITERIVHALETDSNGVVWAGTEGGVFFKDGDTWSPLSGYEKYVGGAVQSIAFAPDGSQWFGTYSGLFRYGPEKTAQVQDVEIMTSEISIEGNYPNPFNVSTTIQFTLPKVTSASCIIYNSIGQRVRSIKLDNVSAGRNSLIWDGKNDIGLKVSSGIYFILVYADSHTASHRMLMLR